MEEPLPTMSKIKANERTTGNLKLYYGKANVFVLILSVLCQTSNYTALRSSYNDTRPDIMASPVSYHILIIIVLIITIHNLHLFDYFTVQSIRYTNSGLFG